MNYGSPNNQVGVKHQPRVVYIKLLLKSMCKYNYMLGLFTKINRKINQRQLVNYMLGLFTKINRKIDFTKLHVVISNFIIKGLNPTWGSKLNYINVSSWCKTPTTSSLY